MIGAHAVKPRHHAHSTYAVCAETHLLLAEAQVAHLAAGDGFLCWAMLAAALPKQQLVGQHICRRLCQLQRTNNSHMRLGWQLYVQS
jgi:hypothetical protein